MCRQRPLRQPSVELRFEGLVLLRRVQRPPELRQPQAVASWFAPIRRIQPRLQRKLRPQRPVRRPRKQIKRRPRSRRRPSRLGVSRCESANELGGKGKPASIGIGVVRFIESACRAKAGHADFAVATLFLGKTQPTGNTLFNGSNDSLIAVCPLAIRAEWAIHGYDLGGSLRDDPRSNPWLEPIDYIRIIGSSCWCYFAVLLSALPF